MNTSEFEKMFWELIEADNSYEYFENQMYKLLTPKNQEYTAFVNLQFETNGIDYFIEILHKNDQTYHVDIIEEDEIDGIGLTNNNAHIRWLEEKKSDLERIKEEIKDNLLQNNSEVDVNKDESENKKKVDKDRLSVAQQALIIHYLKRQYSINLYKIHSDSGKQIDFLFALIGGKVNGDTSNFRKSLSAAEKEYSDKPIINKKGPTIYNAENLKAILEVFEPTNMEKIKEDIKKRLGY